MSYPLLLSGSNLFWRVDQNELQLTLPITLC